MINKVFIIVCSFFLLSNLNAQEELFNKSPKRYKVKDYLHVSLSSVFQPGMKSDLYIYFNKRPIIAGSDNIYEIKFGYKSIRSEFISFKNDTIYYFDLGKIKSVNDYSILSSIEKKPLFILSENFTDSIFVHDFGELKMHYIKLKDICYYSSIKDIAYVFELRYENVESYSSSKDRYYFDRVVISKKYGIIELSFKRFSSWMEFRYY